MRKLNIKPSMRSEEKRPLLR